MLLTEIKFNPIEYKKRNIQIWNEIAHRYHKRWAGIDTGPFQSTTKLVRLAKIKKGDLVLDLACGTGVVINKISSRIGTDGYVIGCDTSTRALKIAKKWNNKKNLDFILCDAENIHFKDQFDVVTCQYALFFFPDSQKALCNARYALKKCGTLAISVHGRNVPFFNSVLDAVTKFIPDYIPPGSPDLDRFGTKKTLHMEVRKAGFSQIKINEFVFRYSPGKFSDYWRNYLKYIAKPLKAEFRKLSATQRDELKDLAKKNTLPFTKKNGTIIFPWQILILVAKK